MPVALIPRHLWSLAPLGAAMLAGAWIVALHNELLWLAVLATVGLPALMLVATWPAWGLAMVLALTPLVTLDIEGVQAFRVALPLLAAWAGLHAATMARTSGASRPTFVLVVLVLIAAMAVSGLGAIDPRGALRQLPEFVTAVIVFFAALQVVDGTRALRIVLTGALAGLTIAAGHGLFQYFSGEALGGEVWVQGQEVARIQALFVHPNYYASYLMVLMPVGAAIALSSAFPRKLRLFAAVAAVIAIPALALTYSRGPMAGLVIGTAAWLLLTRPRIAIPGIALVATAVVALAPGQLVGRFDPDAISQDLGLRAGIWQSAVVIQSEYPVTGAGLGNFRSAYARTAGDTPASDRPSIPQVGGDELPPSAHNEYLNVLAEQGGLGLLAYLILGAVIALTLWRGARASSAASRAVCLGVGCAVMAWAVRGMVDVIAFSEAAIALFAVVGVAAALTHRMDRDRAARELPA